MAGEKKIVNAGFRLPESMLFRIKGLAEAKGITESEFVRMACTEVIDREMNYYYSLNSIFGDESRSGNRNLVEPCSTRGERPEISDIGGGN